MHLESNEFLYKKRFNYEVLLQSLVHDYLRLNIEGYKKYSGKYPQWHKWCHNRIYAPVMEQFPVWAKKTKDQNINNHIWNQRK
jgi:hypothetical protein